MNSLTPLHLCLGLLVAGPFCTSTLAKEMTVVNSSAGCWLSFTDATTRWPALLGQSSAPDALTGWEAPPGSAQMHVVPDDWLAGRIWARTGCDFSDPAKPGMQACLTGGCEGGLECTAYGKPPCTLAELGLGKHAGADFYDLSLVDGLNIPAAITPLGEGATGCVAPGCAADLLAACPTELQTDFDGPGFAHGCSSACIALGHLSSDCCTGPQSSPQTCPGSAVRHRAYFKDRCEQAYSYAFDDATSLFACGGKGKPAVMGYKVGFCPTA